MWKQTLAGALILIGLFGCSQPDETSLGRSIAPIENPGVVLSESADAVSGRHIPVEPMTHEAFGDMPAGKGAGQGHARRGIVTAGDIDDTRNLSAYRRRAATSPGRAFLAQTVGPDGRPAPGVPITLRKAGSDQPFWTGVSGVDGYVTVFPALHGAAQAKRIELRNFRNGQQDQSLILAMGDTRHRVSVSVDSGWQPEFVDMVFVFDTTGSMGDELDWLKREFLPLSRSVARAAPRANLRFGLVAYRDEGDAYVVRNFGFTKRASEMQRWLRSLDANGGGDFPEAADRALAEAVALNWRRGNGERLLFHVGDAPPHRDGISAFRKAAEEAARKQVQIFGLGASGADDTFEALMRHASLITQGRYLFLTDDSGIGLSHAEPRVPCYRVTSLKSLLQRVLQSELRGLRIEAARRDVLRSVGNYRNGVCSQ